MSRPTLEGATLVACPECGVPMTLKRSRFGLYYGCTNWPYCTGTHGAHPNGSPLGMAANTETKKARIAAHDAFDRLWQSRKMKRKVAYRWMREVMQLTADDAHIAKFDESQCTRLVELVDKELAR